MPCTSDCCHGSILFPPAEKRHGHVRSKEELLIHSKNFIDQYFASIKRFVLVLIVMDIVGTSPKCHAYCLSI